MELISRDEAVAKGLKRYFTGEPCKNGHQSQRYTRNSTCLECHALIQSKVRQKRSPEQRESTAKYLKEYKAIHKERLAEAARNKYHPPGWKLWLRPHHVMGMKYCAKCHTYKQLDDFYVSASGRTRCKQCICEASGKKWREDPVFRAKQHKRSRKNALKRYYGLTQDDYDQMLIRQDSGCAICGSSTNTGKHKYLAVDHCHSSGKIRGLLCNSCNTLLGHAKDEITLLEKCIEYLKRHSGS